LKDANDDRPFAFDRKYFWEFFKDVQSRNNTIDLINALEPDIFIISSDNGGVLMEQIFFLDDFIEEESNKYFKKYNLNKDCIIFHRLYEPPVLSIYLEEDIKLSENLKRINEYINWLGNKCKDYITKYIHEIIINDKGYGGLEWYITFDIYSGIIEINENGTMGANITGFDFPGDGWYHNEIHLEEDTIISVERENLIDEKQKKIKRTEIFQ
jgi:hypothetical protein